MNTLPKRIMIIDTETISIEKRFMYDVGFIVAEWNGTRYKAVRKEQYVVKQVYDNKPLFETAYYAEKRPKYISLLKQRKMRKKYLGNVYRRLRSIIKNYNIKQVFAYNSPFDKGVFSFNSLYFKRENPFINTEWVDIKKIAYKYIHKTRQYQDFANSNKLITPKGYIQTNAQSTYQAIINDPNFEEEHMGLQDSEIELAILNECIKLGFNKVENYRQNLISSTVPQYHTIIKNGKRYKYLYHSMKDTKNGLVLN